ncbi:MAG: hypothetical protein AAFX99_07665, partial [Myxococcota bacterium]
GRRCWGGHTKSWEGGIQLWDVDTAQPRCQFNHRTNPQHGALNFTPDGQHLLSRSDTHLMVWDWRTGRSRNILSLSDRRHAGYPQTWTTPNHLVTAFSDGLTFWTPGNIKVTTQLLPWWGPWPTDRPGG